MSNGCRGYPRVDGAGPKCPAGLLDFAWDAQERFWILDHFGPGYASDGNKSQVLGLVEQSTGGGVADVDSGVDVDGSMGIGQLDLPARAAPAAPDGASFIGFAGSFQPINVDDLVGKMGVAFRIYLTNPPNSGDPANDYIIHVGVTDWEGDSSESSDGFYLYADDTLGQGWLLKHRRASSETSVELSLAPTGDVWQTFFLEADVDTGVVRAYGADDGNQLALLGTITPANIQPAVGITPQISMYNGGNVTEAASLYIDYYGIGQEYGVLR